MPPLSRQSSPLLRNPSMCSGRWCSKSNLGASIVCRALSHTCKFCLSSRVRNPGRRASTLDPESHRIYIINIEVEGLRHILWRLGVRDPIQTICVSWWLLFIISMALLLLINFQLMSILNNQKNKNICQDLTVEESAQRAPTLGMILSIERNVIFRVLKALINFILFFEFFGSFAQLHYLK